MPSFLPACIFPVLALAQSAAAEGYDKTIIWTFFLSAYTVIFPLVLGLIGFSRFSKALQYFVILLLLVLISESTAFYLGWQKLNNLIVYDVFTAVEYAFLMIVFSNWFEKRGIRTALLASIPVFLLVWLYGKFIAGSTDQFDSIFLSVESVVFVFLSVIVLIKEMKDSTVLLVDNPVFWVSSGLLVYFAGNLFVFALIDQLLQPGIERFHGAWMIHTVLNVTKNILFSLGFLSTGAPSLKIRSLWRKLRHRRREEAGPGA